VSPTTAVSYGFSYPRTNAKRSSKSCLISFLPNPSKILASIPLFPQLTLASSNLVRHSAARVVAAIAAIEVPMGTWSQLLPFLHQSSTAQEKTHREVGVYILYTVLENIMESFQEHLQSFFKLFEGLLHDPESLEVRITTVRYAIARNSPLCLRLTS
jgi:hypothetical protein